MKLKGYFMKRIWIIIFVLLLPIADGCGRKESAEVKEKQETVQIKQAETKQAETKQAEKGFDNSLEGEEGIRNAIRGYNKAVIEANMRQKNIDKVKRYASGDAIYRVRAFIEERRNNGVVMRSRLSRLVFDEISSDKKTASVKTSELWHYDYVDFEGKLKQPMTEMAYSLSYSLVRFEEWWIVEEIKEMRPPTVKQISPPGPLF